MRALLLAAAVLMAGCATTGDDPATDGSTTTTPATTGTTTTTTTSTPPTSAPPTGDVVIAAFRFTPRDLDRDVGATVTWANQDDVAHTVTADDGSFDSGLIAPGATFALTLAKAGTVPYHCKLHASMKGNVTGVAPPATTTTTTTTTPPTQPSAPTQASVDVSGFRFQPSTVTVAAGGTVTWTNHDSAPHTATADDGSFDSGTLEDGATFRHAFATPGAYAYRCALHGSMRGTVIVQ